MSLGRINGPMLQPNLERQGVNLAIDANLTYWDVNNRYVGVNTTTPNYPLDVKGNVHLGNIYVLGNSITTDGGFKLGLGSVSNISITGGEANSIMFTDGLGNLSFGNLVSIMTLEGFTGNSVLLGTPTVGSFSNAVVLTTNTSVTNAISLINESLGNVSANITLLTSEVYANSNVAAYLTSYNGAILANAVTANLFVGNVSGNVVGSSATFVSINGNLTTSSQPYITQLGTLNSLNVSGDITAGNVSATYNFYGNLTGGVHGNVVGNISGTTASFSNITGNVVTASQPFITSVGTLSSLAVSGNILSGNVSASTISGQFSGNISGTIASFSNISGNVITSSQPFITSVGTLNSLTISGNTNVSNTVATGSYFGNVIADTISPYKTNVVNFINQTAIKLPSGDGSSRPATIAGYFRYNTQLATIEYCDGINWIPFNNQIIDQHISPDGVNTDFALTQPSTAAGLIVSINGTMQSPGSAYTVNGSTISFAEIPQVTDLIDVRFIASAGTTTLDYSIVDTGNILVGTSNVTIDSFLPSLYRSAKYVISSSNGTDASMLEAHLVQINGISTISTTANVNTGVNSLTLYTTVSGGSVNFIAKGTTAANQVRVQRTYFNI
jgi:hypothetical protein